MSEHADIVIVGGGPVGAALAVELAGGHANRRLRVVLLDPRPGSIGSSDVRPIALSHGSRLILERLGLWGALAGATPIERIHVSQRGAFGRVLLTAQEAQVPALGHVVDYASLVGAFDAAVAAANVHTVRGAHATNLENTPAGAVVRFQTAEGTRECAAELAVLAEGGALEALGAAEVREYGQSAITARVKTSRAHRNTAYERFTSRGPVALLPFGDEFALVWTTRTDEAAALADAAPETFLQTLGERFGERVGQFVAVSARAVHPLSLRIARVNAMQRVIAIGNAAQTLHPVAGQGLNLGLRDAWELACELRERGVHENVVSRFEARRRFDRAGGIAFTDNLVSLFSNDSRVLAIARGAGLALMDTLPPVKDFLVRRMMFGARG